MKRRAFIGGMIAAPAIAVPAYSEEFVVPPEVAKRWQKQFEALNQSVRGEFAYCRAGELALGWDYEEKPVHSSALKVIDLDTGLEVKGVTACNAFKGELRRHIKPYVLDSRGELTTEYLTGNFAIVRA